MIFSTATTEKICKVEIPTKSRPVKSALVIDMHFQNAGALKWQ
jgi:hypothetical protein